MGVAITRVDDRHYAGVVKMNGSPFGTSNGTFSADGKTLTVESVTLLPGGKSTKVLEIWVRQ
jgi:hypothetical protein